MRLGQQYYQETRRLLASPSSRRQHMLAMALARRAVLCLLATRYTEATVTRHTRQIDTALDGIQRQACLDVLWHVEG